MPLVGKKKKLTVARYPIISIYLVRAMKKQSPTVFFVVSLAVALLAAASVIVRVAVTESRGRATAREEFAELSALLAPVHGSSDLASPELRSRLAVLYRRTPDLLLVSVYERDSGIRYRLPDRSPYLPEAENAKALPTPAYPPQSALLIAAPLSSDVSGRLAVEALFVVLPQIAVFRAFRDAALGLAAYLVLAAIFLFVMGRIDAKGSNGEGTEQEAAEDEVGTSTEASGGDKAEPEDQEGQPATEAVYASPGEEEFDIPVLRDEASDAESQVPTAPEATASGKPDGLYSPLSGLGWESYLGDRLDAELARSASFEQDLSLLYILYEGLSPEKAEYKLVADSLSEFFSFKDLAFERGSDGFAVLLPNIDAEHGIRMAEEFLKKLTFILRELRDPLSYLPLFMGLSSRSGRLVDGARLGQEAQAALQKARAEHDSHIIAFKPDPDRYRIYLASKGL